MSNCECNVTTGRLKPGVFNLKQFMNETESMIWDVSSCSCNGHDLTNYDAFLVLQKGDGEPDEVKLAQVTNPDGTMTLTWNVGTYATWLRGYVKYQIVFRGKVLSGLGVIGCAADEDGNGDYIIESELVDGHNRVWTNNAHSTCKITWDFEHSRWQIKKGDTLLAYQTFATDEPCRGTWEGALVANNTACAFTSLEAVMYVSDSVAADAQVSAKCPTILRQMWYGLHNMVVTSGATIVANDIEAADWTGTTAPYSIALTGLDVPDGCVVEAVKVQKDADGGGYTEVANIDAVKSSEGVWTVRALEKIAGRVCVTIKGGNDSVYIARRDLTDETRIAAQVEADAADARDCALQALASEGTATTKAGEASASATAAATSESNAATSASEASASASTATTAASTATTAANTATTRASQASAYAADADAAAILSHAMWARLATVPASGVITLSAEATIYSLAPTAATTLSIVTPTFIPPNTIVTFELLIDMPATAVELTWPSAVTWLGDSPDLSEGGKKYLFAFRWFGGSSWIANEQGAW